MSSKKKPVNELKDIALENFGSMEILVALTDGLYEKREAMPDKKLSLADERRWEELLDLMYYLEKDNGNNRDEEFPVTDPQALIRRQVKEKLIDKDEGAALQDKFNKAVRDAAGHDLSDKQIQKLYKVFRSFDPVAPSLKP